MSSKNPPSYTSVKNLLNRYVKKVDGKFVLKLTQEETGAKSFRELAEIIPVTEQAYKYLHSETPRMYESGLNACKKKYSELLNMKTTIKADSFLDKRITSVLGRRRFVFDELPLKTILANPLANKNELEKIKRNIADFYDKDTEVTKPIILNNDGTYQYKHLNSSYEGLLAFNHLEMLALRLVLFREAALGLRTPEGFDHNIKGSLLLFLRLLINEDMTSIQDELLKLLYIFYEINDNNHMSENDVWHILEDKDSSIYLQKLFNKILPEGGKLQPYMLSLESYLENNMEIKRVIENKVLHRSDEFPLIDTDYQFCVDYFCDEWLSGKIERINLLKPSFKHFNQLKKILLAKPPVIRIW